MLQEPNPPPVPLPPPGVNPLDELDRYYERRLNNRAAEDDDVMIVEPQAAARPQVDAAAIARPQAAIDREQFNARPQVVVDRERLFAYDRQRDLDDGVEYARNRLLFLRNTGIGGQEVRHAEQVLANFEAAAAAYRARAGAYRPAGAGPLPAASAPAPMQEAVEEPIVQVEPFIQPEVDPFVEPEVNPIVQPEVEEMPLDDAASVGSGASTASADQADLHGFEENERFVFRDRNHLMQYMRGHPDLINEFRPPGEVVFRDQAALQLHIQANIELDHVTESFRNRNRWRSFDCC